MEMKRSARYLTANGSRRGGMATAQDGALVDVALVLAIDGSGSISKERLMLQIGGYMDALRHPAFIDAVRSGNHGRIALTFVEWTDARRQDQVVGWRLIETSADANTFAQSIQDAMLPLPGWTSISAAIDFSAKLFAHPGFVASRRVIDISG